MTRGQKFKRAGGRIAALCAVICATVAFTSACRGEEVPEDRALLEALRADDFDARDSAKKKLIARGEAVRAIITAELAKNDLDPDYKDSLKAIAGKLKDADVLKAFDAPKRIDLDLKDETVNAALEKLKVHFGFESLAKGDAGTKKVTLHLAGATYLEALDGLRKAANLAYDRNEIMQQMFRKRGKNGVESAGGLALRENGADGLVPAAAKGPVLAFFESINYNLSRNINFGNEGKKTAVSQKNFNIQGFLILEPDVRCAAIGLSNMRASGANNEAVGSGTVSLNNYWGGADAKAGFRIYNFNAGFVPQAEPPAVLDWKMTAKVQVPVKVAEKRLENLSELVGKAQEFLGGAFTINKLERDGRGTWKISYTSSGALMEMSAGGRMSRWNNGVESMAAGNPDFAAGMFIVDAQGKTLDGGSYSGSGGGNSYHAELELASEPRAILFRKPGDSQTREFELSIPGVPVP